LSAEILMPRLSDSMEEGTILTWIKSVGDPVALGDELVEIETDKANMVFEADAAGTLIEIVAAEGDTLPIGEVIARVGEPGEAGGDGGGGPPGSPRSAADRPPDAPPFPAAPPDPPAAEREAGERTPSAAEPVAGVRRVKASPLARRIARERGLDLSALSGSGPGGRIIKLDVEAAGAGADGPPAAVAPTPRSEAPPPPGPETAKGAVTVIEPTKLQATVARRMSESKATVPHFYLSSRVDMSRAVGARAALRAAAGEGEVVPSLNDLVVKAAAIALREHPRANAAYRDGRFELYERVNVGIAVAAEAALVVPTIFDADRKGLAQIATESRALATRVREGSITPPELGGGTFTVSNLGMYGVSEFGAVINTPQAAILAVGAVTESAVVRDRSVTTAELMGVTLACDHRILYGADAAAFLARVRALLEEPLGLAL